MKVVTLNSSAMNPHTIRSLVLINRFRAQIVLQVWGEAIIFSIFSVRAMCRYRNLAAEFIGTRKCTLSVLKGIISSQKM